MSVWKSLPGFGKHTAFNMEQNPLHFLSVKITVEGPWMCERGLGGETERGREFVRSVESHQHRTKEELLLSSHSHHRNWLFMYTVFMYSIFTINGQQYW